MQKKQLDHQDDGFIANFRYRRNWKCITSLLAVFVVIGTISSLMLPAITMSRIVCGFEEHIHIENCYKTSQVPSLLCNPGTLETHRHSSDCMDADGNLICKQVDFVVHTHDSACRDADGSLVCSLKEVKEHKHNDSCYQITETIVDEGHAHNDNCYEWIISEAPTCGIQESAGHVHGDGCFASETTLTCTETEFVGHAHGDNCYKMIDTLTCGTEESDGHNHGDDCYGEDGALVCSQEEISGHVHETGCYTQTKDLICVESEIGGHIHNSNCYIEAGTLVCTTEETPVHQHSEECYGLVKGNLICSEEEREPVIEAGDPALICEEPEVVLHSHKGTCYEYDDQGNPLSLICGQTEITKHQHAEGCFTETEVQNLVCDIPEHTHTDECKESDLTEEEQFQLDSFIQQMEALPDTQALTETLASLTEARDLTGWLAAMEDANGKAQAVRILYDELNLKLQACVSSIEKLTDLEALLAEAVPPTLTEEEKGPVDALIALIDSLPTPEELASQPTTLEEGQDNLGLQALASQVKTARDTYNSLNSVQQAAVSNEAHLTALETFLSTQNIGPTVAELQEAQSIYNDIAALPSVEEAQAEFDALAAEPETLAAYQAKLAALVKGLMARYEALHEEAKATVTNLQALTGLISWLEEIGLIEGAPDYTVSNGSLSAEVRVTGTELPEGVQFILDDAAYSPEETERMAGLVNAHLAELGNGISAYVVMDMHFADADGNEIPFSGTAKVTLTFAEPILPGVQNPRVFHIFGETVENVGKDIVRTEAGITSVTLITNGFSPMVIADASAHIEEKLNGDYAYIYDAIMKADENTTSGEAISTGTASWDNDDNPGNDTSAANSILRTFDVATYTLSYKTGLRKEATDQGINGYRTGTVYFEFILPLNEKQGQFEPGSMGWLATYKDVKYEIITKDTRQILRGSFLAEPSADNPATIGNSISEMNVAIRVLRMKQGEKVQPSFTLWLDGNQVDAGVVNGIPTKTVTGTNGTCETHGEQEFKTVTPEKITISAAPRFNVALKKGDTGSTSYIETFDFSTGNDKALDKISESMNGRLVGYGLTLQLAGKDKTSGLKGVEVPDEGSSITFDVTLSSTYTKEGGSVVNLGNTEYRPRVWSAAPNMRDVAQPDERGITGSVVDFMRAGAPYNKKPDENNNPNNVNQKFLDYCHDGGNWSFSQDASKPNVIHVTVTDFSIDLSSLQNFPAAVAAHNGESNSCQYYNPADTSLQNAWDIQFACFSAAEFWTFQPLQAKVGGTSKKIQDTYGNGSIEFKIQDTNLKLNNQTTPQAVTTDDQLADGIGLTQTGSKQVQIHYIKPGRGWGSPLTDDCFENGYDWATPGQDVAIYQLMVNDNAMGDSRGAAYEMLIKWDDVFFEPTGDYWTDCSTPITGGTWWNGEEPVVQVLWATRGDGLGWKHNGLNPDQSEGSTTNANYDWNMIQATPDMLTYYSTLAEVKAEGKVPVGLLIQYRGICGPGQNHIEIRVEGKVKESCPPGYVYMATHFATMWTVDNLAVPARDHYYKTHKDTTAVEQAYWNAHREEIIDNYARTIMPLRSAEPKLLDYMVNRVDGHSNRTKADWIRGHSGTADQFARYTVSLGSDFSTMRKIWYKDGQTGGTNNDYLLDSCLVPEHVTSIKKNTAQTSTQNGVTENKQTYSLDLNQRVVDYALTPSITRTLGDGAAAVDSKTTLTIVDTLPAELEYVPDTAYWGGTYTQDPKCMAPGAVTGGTKLDPVAVKNADGTTTLTWTLENVSLATHGTVELSPIYFSARLTGDFVDQQGIDNLVTVRSTGDNKRPLTQVNNNKAIYGITIQMSKSTSIVKLADQDRVEINAPHGFTMYVGNNSSHDLNNQIIVDDFPYNNDEGGTNVHGAINVTEFTVNKLGLGNVNWFYTTDTNFQGKTSIYYMGDGKTVGVAGRDANQIDYFTTANGWYPMTFDANGKCTNLPVDTVQVVGVGTVPAGQTIQMHTTVELPESEGGDVIYNDLMMDSLNSRASSRVVSRSLSGLTWIDSDHDGIQNENEMPAKSGVKVTLMKLENGEYKDVATIQTGQKCDVIRGETVASYEQGKYLFYNLLPGTYAVRFEKGDFDITYFHPSPVDTGQNLDNYDQMDSDGVPAMGADHTLLKTEIKGIYMPTIEEMGTANTFESPYHDSGFYAWGAVLPATGGAGTYLYTFSGWAVMMVACALMYKTRKKRKGAR